MQKNTSKKDAVIIVSGGMDSVTLLHEYRERIALAITFDYGSNHARREIACARENCPSAADPFHPCCIIKKEKTKVNNQSIKTQNSDIY